MTIQPNQEAFNQVCAALKQGQQLTIEMMLDVFGKDAALLFILAFLDASDAARAIQISMARLQQSAQQEGEVSFEQVGDGYDDDEDDDEDIECRPSTIISTEV